jgi:aspartate aminotransferase
MTISQLARSITESPTLKMNEEARLLRERGESVIHLGIGEPKNKTPFPALLSAAAKLNTGDIKYSPTDGIPTLKKAIVRYTEENYDRLAAPENIIVSSGAKQSLFNIFFALIDPGDEVIINAPYWVSYPEMIKMVRGVPVIVTPEDGGFYPRLADIERAVSSATKAIVINSPNNPSGVMYSDEFMADIVKFCEKRSIYLILDDIYHKLVFSKRKWSPAYRYTDRDMESAKIIVVNGIAKAYGMTGFRIGWCVANRKLVEVLTNIQGQITSCAAMVSQAAAEGALNGLQSVVEALRLTIENNREVMMTELGAFSGVRCTPPDGTFYCLPDFRAYNGNSVELANFLLRRARVVTVPGKDFGMEGYLRLSYAGTAKDVSEGIARIRWALDPNAPSEIYIGDRKMVRDWM